VALAVWTLIGFALIVGSMALVRWWNGRAAGATIDDPSILLAAPPEGMTPAVAARVDDAPLSRSFTSGLLDLASRGEIEFVAERVSRSAAEVGIQIGGAQPDDERLTRNRRQPAGEAEAWLLGRLLMAAGHPHHAPWDADALTDLNLPLELAASAATASAVLRESAQTADEEESGAAKAARERGLLLERAEAVYITAHDARALPIPTLFGTFLETYARRHGWLGTLPFFTRLRWRIFGVVAVITGIAFLSSGMSAYSDAKTGLGMGLLFGGLVAFLIAPWMVQPTAQGGRVRAQLNAYRRTLQATFAQAATITDVVARAGLNWLATPDQVIAWAVALGLAPDLEALLARSAQGTADDATDAPAWYRPIRHKQAGEVSPAQMFAGIESIGATGSVGPGFLRPMRSWWA
jgi:hypothetical protein